MERLTPISDRLERLCLVLALAIALVFQGLVAAGAADIKLNPALSAPDGGVLTYSDICNSSGRGLGKGKHCGACIPLSAAVLGISISCTAPETLAFIEVFSFFEGIRALGPEARYKQWRAPPQMQL